MTTVDQKKYLTKPILKATELKLPLNTGFTFSILKKGFLNKDSSKYKSNNLFSMPLLLNFRKMKKAQINWFRDSKKRSVWKMD